MECFISSSEAAIHSSAEGAWPDYDYRSSTSIPYDLASLRPGGATHLLHRFEGAEFVRRRGRWLSARVCEVYLQEIAIATCANHLSPEVQQKIQKLADSFTEVLERAVYFLDHAIPSCAWPKLW